jgi:hypothetical protein
LEQMGTAISDWKHRRTASGIGSSYPENYFGVSIMIRVAIIVLALQGMVVRLFLDLVYGRCLTTDFATRLVILTGPSGVSVLF